MHLLSSSDETLNLSVGYSPRIKVFILIQTSLYMVTDRFHFRSTSHCKMFSMVYYISVCCFGPNRDIKYKRSYLK